MWRDLRVTWVWRGRDVDIFNETGNVNWVWLGCDLGVTYTYFTKQGGVAWV